MNYIKYLFLITATWLLVGCSDKEIIEPSPEIPSSGSTLGEGVIVLSLNVEAPELTGTRSTTQDNGGSSGDKNNANPEEEGTDNENGINTASISFFDAATDTPLLTIDGFKFDGSKLWVEIKASEIADIVGKKVKIYIVGNCSAELRDPFGASFSAGSIEDGPLGNNLYGEDNKLEGKNVPVAIKYEYIIDLTALSGTSDSEILQSLAKLVGKGYYEDSRTLNLSEVVNPEKVESKPVSTVQLERCVARTDFKPNSGKDVDGNTQLPLNIYRVGEIENLYAKMNSLQIINISREGYVFRHTSQGNEEVGYIDGKDPILFGNENSNPNFGQNKPDDWDKDNTGETWDNSSFKWIYDTDWDEKKDPEKAWEEAWKNDSFYGPYRKIDNKIFYDYFINQPTKETGDPIYYVHQDEEKQLHGVLDVWDLLPNTYKAVCYMMENTLPSTKAMINGLSTGIAFNMYLCKKDGTPLVYNTEEDQSDFIPEVTFRNQQAAYETACDNWLKAHSNWEEDYKGWVAQEENKNKSKDEYKAEHDYPTNDNDGKVAITSIEPYKYRENNVEKTSDDFYKITIGEAVTYAKKTKVKINVSTENGEGETVTTTEERDAFVITYYYYFRHNISKNHVLGVVEPMQFAVVRNNIYKVSVTSLNGLPEPYDPKKSDEPEENYISVELNILSWAVEDRVVDL